MNMRKPWILCVLTIAVLLLTVLSGCAGDSSTGKVTASTTTAKQTQDTKTETSESSVKETEINEGRDKNYLSAAEALKLAYEEAKKWSDDVLFRRITIGSQLSVHYNWPETEMAFHWSVSFISPAKKQDILLYVNYGEIERNVISDNSLKNMPYEGHPNDRSLIPLKEAYATAVRNGAVFGLMPVNITYETDGYSENEFPHWLFVFRVPVADGEEEIHYYYINALTGELSDEFFKGTDGKETAKAGLKVKDQDLSGLAGKTDQRYTVILFFTYINEGRADLAVELMDDTMLSNADTKKMWIQSLGSIAGHKYLSGGFVTEDEDNWTEDTQRFEIEIMIPDGLDCEQYGWEHGSVKRWMTLKKYGDVWKVHELSTSP